MAKTSKQIASQGARLIRIVSGQFRDKLTSEAEYFAILRWLDLLAAVWCQFYFRMSPNKAVGLRYENGQTKIWLGNKFIPVVAPLNMLAGERESTTKLAEMAASLGYKMPGLVDDRANERLINMIPDLIDLGINFLNKMAADGHSPAGTVSYYEVQEHRPTIVRIQCVNDNWSAVSIIAPRFGDDSLFAEFEQAVSHLNRQGQQLAVHDPSALRLVGKDKPDTWSWIFSGVCRNIRGCYRRRQKAEVNKAAKMQSHDKS